jgi:5'-3' exonuclease
MKKLSPIRPQLKEEDQLTKILLLVDYANVLYRSYFSGIKDMELHPWVPVVRFIDSLRLLVQRAGVGQTPIEIIFAGESRTTLDRTKIDGTYKKNRIPVKDENFIYFRKIMPRILEDMDAEIVSRDGAEADDIIASVVNYICVDPLPWIKPKESTTDVFIFSGDKDLYQLLRYDRCYIYNFPGVFYTKNNFIEEYGFEPSYFDSYKAMVGDSSDNISGVDGIGPVNAKKHILNSTIPIDDPGYLNAMKLIELNYDLDVPDVGDRLWFDFELSRSKPLIFDAYENYNTELAFMEIQLAVKMLAEVYKKGYN